MKSINHLISNNFELNTILYYVLISNKLYSIFSYEEKVYFILQIYVIVTSQPGFVQSGCRCQGSSVKMSSKEKLI